MFNQTHKISENNTALTAALTTTFSNTKDTIYISCNNGLG